METRQVGEYEVRALNVEEGMSLIGLTGDDQGSRFQTELILKTVTRNGQPIGQDEFGKLVPHLADVIKAAMELNGFSPTSGQE